MTKSGREPHQITLQSRIPNDAKGLSLLTFLSQRFRYLDRTAWSRELADGRIQLDGHVAGGDEVLRGGMKLRYDKLHREPEVRLDYRILHQDEWLLAVDKPAHLPMHADGPFIRNTLVYRLREQLGDDLQLVHRLDRETSGVCIVARSKTAQALIQSQFSPAPGESGVRKEYLAVVRGRLENVARCEQPIGHKRGREVSLRRSAAADAENPKSACTTVEPLRHGPDHTLVRCLPETGRTHQIRVHLEHLGHPIVGDKLYGHPDSHYLDFVARMKAGQSVFVATDDAPDRQLLHAHRLHLRHPNDDRETCFEAPMPEEFERWLLS